MTHRYTHFCFHFKILITELNFFNLNFYILLANLIHLFTFPIPYLVVFKLSIFYYSFIFGTELTYILSLNSLISALKSST